MISSKRTIVRTKTNRQKANVQSHEAYASDVRRALAVFDTAAAAAVKAGISMTVRVNGKPYIRIGGKDGDRTDKFTVDMEVTKTF